MENLEIEPDEFAVRITETPISQDYQLVTPSICKGKPFLLS